MGPAIACFASAFVLYLMSDDGVGTGLTLDRLVALILVGVFLFAGVRALTMQLVISETDVTLRNFLRTQRWPIGEVLGVATSTYRLMGLPSVALVLSNGDHVNVTALQPPNRAFRQDDETSELIDDANRGLRNAKCCD